MPWRRIDRWNQIVDTAMALPVSPHETNVFATRNVASDWLNRSHNVTVAFASCVKAHSSVICRKNRRTDACASTPLGIGQKSRTRRSANGRPSGTDSRNAAATRAVPSVGCRK